MSVKGSVGDLAIFSGSHAFDKQLHVNRPNIGQRETFDRYVDKIWQSRWLTNSGPLVSQLEQNLQQWLGVEHCVMVSSGTSGLAILVNALELTGEVIMPAFTFVSTAHVLQWVGITPVFCDIDPVTWNIDCNQCEGLITDRTSAIIPTHLWGRACDIGRLQNLADQHGLQLIFDAAHAFGCTYQSRMIGEFGNAEVFSFQANKAFHTAEGGAVTTNDSVLADRLRAIRNFGFTAYDQVECLGTNAKLSELSAAMGLTNLEVFESSVAAAKANYDLYQKRLAGVACLSMQLYDLDEKNNYQYISLLLDQQCGLSRDAFVQILHAENVLARRYFYPGCHRMEPYRTLFPNSDDNLSNTNCIANNVIILPGGSGVTTDDVERLCGLLAFIVENAHSINAKLTH